MMVDVDEQTGTVYMYPKVMEDYYQQNNEEHKANEQESQFNTPGAYNLANLDSDDEEAAPPGGNGYGNGYHKAKSSDSSNDNYRDDWSTIV